jgi:hypothetical protein
MPCKSGSPHGVFGDLVGARLRDGRDRSECRCRNDGDQCAHAHRLLLMKADVNVGLYQSLIPKSLTSPGA